MHTEKEDLVEKIAQLPAERIAELHVFVEFLLQRESDTALTKASSRLGTTAFERVWDNAEDAVYDQL